MELEIFVIAISSCNRGYSLLKVVIVAFRLIFHYDAHTLRLIVIIVEIGIGFVVI